MSSLKNDFPVFYKTFIQCIEKWRHHYLRSGRPATYLGSNKVITCSNFGHSYVTDVSNLEALKPLFIPSASDLAISALTSILHTSQSYYTCVNALSCYHPLNLAHLVQNTGLVFLLDEDKQLLLQSAKNFYLNDMQDRVKFCQLIDWKKNQLPEPKILQVLETDFGPSHQQTAINPSLDTAAFIQSLDQIKSNTIESLFHDESLKTLRGIVIDDTVRLACPERDFSKLIHLNPSCYFLLRLSPVHADQWPSISQRWRSKGYEFWQLPDLQLYSGPMSTSQPNPQALEDVDHAYVFSRWVLLAHPLCF